MDFPTVVKYVVMYASALTGIVLLGIARVSGGKRVKLDPTVTEWSKDEKLKIRIAFALFAVAIICTII